MFDSTEMGMFLIYFAAPAYAVFEFARETFAWQTGVGFIAFVVPLFLYLGYRHGFGKEVVFIPLFWVSFALYVIMDTLSYEGLYVDMDLWLAWTVGVAGLVWGLALSHLSRSSVWTYIWMPFVLLTVSYIGSNEGDYVFFLLCIPFVLGLLGAHLNLARIAGMNPWWGVPMTTPLAPLFYLYLAVRKRRSPEA